ncbi:MULTISPECIES: sensor histidine kinase [Cellulomonas]|uniref:histidine kinase n=1 Tax=Cellulomonas oligotrophica TaxID=931536 RepID=A0A7Y9FDG1_9CELL|nr:MULTISPECIES: PAS domain-containing sensor histidine kinase [Cellulomonas]NYD85255.1 two-component sensor histidine kinase [Cellulomonas oligotrophica]TQL03633.1 two-component sensor histidine kinase [Cellulomonas sp. SLBN-39]GIG33309.1 histidine kinase [Cellulomonas oligotrophica]
MSTLSDLVAHHGPLGAPDLEWLHLLVGDWQVISDLAFADLVMWLPVADGDFVAVAQCRPSTGATVHYDDVVGSRPPDGQRPQLRRALVEQAPQRSREPRWFGSYAVREEAVPVVRDGRAIAVIARQTNLGGARTPSRLELNYVEAADDLLGMVARGEFPATDAPTGPRRGAPRVGDGLVRLNGEGEVLYASPNALSCFHRLGALGDLTGRSLVEVTADLIEQNATVDESMPLVLMGRAPWRVDVEARGVALSLRAVPLTERSERVGAVLLCRDVSELRRRERELITKDATIREIHHRVKNNLQTVAALLRLQSRRMSSPEARDALAEAMRRVATIALVHETLSQTLDESVPFDDLVGRSLRLAADVATAGAQVRTTVRGSFGAVPAEDATALALVLTELVTNAVEHGFDGRERGTVEVVAVRDEDALRVEVNDDGAGVPAEQGAGTGLGTQIVLTLVRNELGGSIEWLPREGGGTSVVIEARLRQGRDAATVA